MSFLVQLKDPKGDCWGTLMAAVAQAGEVKKEVVSAWCIPSYHLVHECLWLPDSFHSFHMYLSGVIHKKVAQITKVRLTKQLPPEIYILRTMKRKIQRVGSTDSNTWHRWCWCMLLSKETDVSRLSTYYLHSLQIPFPNILGENCF